MKYFKGLAVPSLGEGPEYTYKRLMMQGKLGKIL